MPPLLTPASLAIASIVAAAKPSRAKTRAAARRMSSLRCNFPRSTPSGAMDDLDSVCSSTNANSREDFQCDQPVEFELAHLRLISRSGARQLCVALNLQ